MATGLDDCSLTLTRSYQSLPDLPSLPGWPLLSWGPIQSPAPNFETVLPENSWDHLTATKNQQGDGGRGRGGGREEEEEGGSWRKKRRV